MAGQTNTLFPVPNYHHLHLRGPGICLCGSQLIARVGSYTSTAHVGKPFPGHPGSSGASNRPPSSPDP